MTQTPPPAVPHCPAAPSGCHRVGLLRRRRQRRRPALADRLGLPFLQRVNHTSAAPSPGPGPCDEQLSAEEVKTTPVHRLLARSLRRCRPGPPSRRRPPTTRTSTCAATARPGSAAWPADGGGVILGRAAAVVLGKDRGFHVRLDGPPAASRRPGRRDRGHQRRRGEGSACARPTRPAPPTSAACTGAIRPTRPCTTW